MLEPSHHVAALGVGVVAVLQRAEEVERLTRRVL